MKTLLMMVIMGGTLLKFTPAIAQTNAPRIVPTTNSNENAQSSLGVDPNLSSHQEGPDQLAAVISTDSTTGTLLDEHLKPTSLSETCCGVNVVHTTPITADPNLFSKETNSTTNKDEENTK